jgi:GAF domain/Ribbon-helix-helix protein, copG family
VGLKATTIRVSPDLWELLEREAARQEVSVAQFVRDAALLRVGQLAGVRGDGEGLVTVEELAARSTQGRRRFSGSGDDGILAAEERLKALHRTGLVDAPTDPALDRLAKLAAKALDAPVALLTLVDKDRQVFAAAYGLDEPWASEGQTGLLHSLCQHVVVSVEPLVCTDAREHRLVHDNLAIRDLNVISYAGVPLTTEDGQTIGSFCVIEHKPRRWTSHEVEVLGDFAASVMAHVATLGGDRSGRRAAAARDGDSR